MKSMSNDSKPRKILHIFRQMNRGGAEMRTLDVMRKLDRAQFQLDFCALSGKTGQLDSEIRDLGGQVHYCKLGISFALNFLRLLRRNQYDVVHAHVYYPSGIMLLLARFAGVPVRIAHFRSTKAGEGRGKLRDARNTFLRWLIDKNATHILAVSEGALRASWTNHLPADGRSRVVYNGIDADQYRTFSETDRIAVREELRLGRFSPLFVHVGRFTKAKNHERLIEIFELVARQCPEAALLLVGGGAAEPEEEIRALVKAKGLQERVIFAGIRSDVPVLLSLSDCMIFPSRWEGLPGAVLEAVAMGVPVVGSDIPGIFEIAEHTSLVKTISLHDSDEVWSRQILKALGDKSNAEGFPTGTPFDMATAVSTFSDLWSSLKQKGAKVAP